MKTEDTPPDAEIMKLITGYDTVALATRCLVILNEIDLNEDQRRKVARRAKRVTNGDDPLAAATHCMVVLNGLLDLSDDQRDEINRRVALVRHLRHECSGSSDLGPRPRWRLASTQEEQLSRGRDYGMLAARRGVTQ